MNPHGRAFGEVSIKNVAAENDALPALARLMAVVLADETLAARLAALEDGAAFVAQAIDTARARAIVLPEANLVAAMQPDPLGLRRWSTPALVGSSPLARHWLPVAVGVASGAICVDWAWVGPEPLRSPFYEDDIRRALRRPFNRVFRYRTGLGDIIGQAQIAESLAPAGFIFHMSRCGSTLVAQMLAMLAESIVISEAAPIDAVVQFARGLSIEDGAEALRAIVAAFGRKRSGGERHYVVKLDCWHTLALPLFRRAFPDTPWVFLYRDPVEVLVSQMRQRGMQMVPQFSPPRVYGITDADADAEMGEDYCARVIGAICQAALDHRVLPRGLFVNYQDLPAAVSKEILPHFGIACDEREQERMRAAARQDAKSPTVPFSVDSDAKQHEATDSIRRAADRHLGAIYAGLEARRATSRPRQGADLR